MKKLFKRFVVLCLFTVALLALFSLTYAEESTDISRLEAIAMEDSGSNNHSGVVHFYFYSSDNKRVIPSSLGDITVCIFDKDGNYARTYKHHGGIFSSRTGDYFVLLDNLERGSILAIDVETSIGTEKKYVRLGRCTEVKYYPNIKLNDVRFPFCVAPNTEFEITGTIAEVDGDLGMPIKAELCRINNTVIASSDQAQINAGDSSEFSIKYKFPNPGIYTLKLQLSGPMIPYQESTIQVEKNIFFQVSDNSSDQQCNSWYAHLLENIYGVDYEKENFEIKLSSKKTQKPVGPIKFKVESEKGIFADFEASIDSPLFTKTSSKGVDTYTHTEIYSETSSMTTQLTVDPDNGTRITVIYSLVRDNYAEHKPDFMRAEKYIKGICTIPLEDGTLIGGEFSFDLKRDVTHKDYGDYTRTRDFGAYSGSMQ